jgi:FKBP-type peptidyl-prolyl cis-trans isomerase FklB
MKNLFLAITVFTLASTGLAQQKLQLKDSKDKVSYSIGLDIGNTFKRQKLDINLEVLFAGLKDAISGATPLMTEDQVKETLAAFSKEMMEKQAAERKVTAEANEAVGKKFLAENKTKPGVKTTASGLQYKVLKEGTGPSPKTTDSVVANYKGTLIDGKEFDSSYKRNEPATFPVSGVIKGWTEALQLMKVGSKYQLFVPPDLAYSSRGAGPDIGPNATLIFEVELVGIKPPANPTPPEKHVYDSAAPPNPAAGVAPSPAKAAVSPVPSPKG